MARCISVMSQESHPFTIWNFENVINVVFLIIPWSLCEKKPSLLLFYNKGWSKDEWSSHPTLHDDVLSAIACVQEVKIFPFISNTLSLVFYKWNQVVPSDKFPLSLILQQFKHYSRSPWKINKLKYEDQRKKIRLFTFLKLVR